LNEYLDEICHIAKTAGVEIIKFYQCDFSVQFKLDQSPLTQADNAAHDVIASKLHELSPSIPILSEEDIDSFKKPNKSGRYWLVDPLDGTKEFINQNNEFTVNIALIEYGVPVLGVVYAPAMRELYFAAKDCGAWKKFDNGSVRPLFASPRDARDYVAVVSSRSHANQQTMDYLKRFDSQHLVALGSSLRFCLIAEGLADVYPRFGPTSLWDTAAAHAILLEAGGNVFDLNGEPLNYANPNILLNPYFIACGQEFKHLAIN